MCLISKTVFSYNDESPLPSLKPELSPDYVDELSREIFVLTLEQQPVTVLNEDVVLWTVRTLVFVGSTESTTDTL